MKAHIELNSDNELIIEGDNSEITLELADRTQEQVFLNKKEVGVLINALTIFHQSMEDFAENK